MTRALPITERQARSLLRAAKKENSIIEVKVGDTFVRLIPANLAQPEKPIVRGRDIKL